MISIIDFISFIIGTAIGLIIAVIIDYFSDPKCSYCGRKGVKIPPICQYCEQTLKDMEK